MSNDAQAPTISESDSEKPKRGRPRITSAMDDAFFRHFFPGCGRRTATNHCHMHRAMRLLGRNSEATWLYDAERTVAGEVKLRFTILAELGRIDDDDLLLEVAAELCRLKPKARDAIAMIRRLRGAQCEPKYSHTVALTYALLTTIEEYITRHEATWDEVESAIVDVSQMTHESRVEQEEANHTGPKP